MHNYSKTKVPRAILSTNGADQRNQYTPGYTSKKSEKRPGRGLCRRNAPISVADLSKLHANVRIAGSRAPGIRSVIRCGLPHRDK